MQRSIRLSSTLCQTPIRAWCAVGISLVLISIAFVTASYPAIAAETPEARIKVAFIYNFMKFVTWPEPFFSSQAELSLCVLGDDALSESLASLKSRTAQGRALAIVPAATLDRAKGCHLVFVSGSEKGRVDKISRALADSSALTVSDIVGFAETGGMIELANVEGKMAFDVNLETARRAGLSLSSQLLKVARNVHTGKGN
jgi:hypothetical protein